MILPRTVQACHRMIRQLMTKKDELMKQCEADSDAMNTLADEVTKRDRLLVEKCKTCSRGIR